MTLDIIMFKNVFLLHTKMQNHNLKYPNVHATMNTYCK